MAELNEDALFILGSTLSCLCTKRLLVLKCLIGETSNLDGEIWECGAYRGGTALCMALFLKEFRSNRLVRAFDTFEGMPLSGPLDTHPVGSFAEADYEEACEILLPMGNVAVHKGVMPASFAGLRDSKISLVHLDVDQYQSVADCLEFVYPRLQVGGFVVVDDYNCPACLGAKKATHEFMQARRIKVSGLQTRQTPQVFFRKDVAS